MERWLLTCSVVVVAAVVVVAVDVATVVVAVVFLSRPRVETEICLLAWRLR